MRAALALAVGGWEGCGGVLCCCSVVLRRELPPRRAPGVAQGGVVCKACVVRGLGRSSLRVQPLAPAEQSACHAPGPSVCWSPGVVVHLI